MRLATKLAFGAVITGLLGTAQSLTPVKPAESGSTVYCNSRFWKESPNGTSQSCNWSATKEQACKAGVTTTIENDKFVNAYGGIGGACPEESPYAGDELRVYVMK